MPRIKAQDIESKSLDGAVDDPETIPTDEELKTLRRVPASMPWPALLLCIAELAERASYYGTSGLFFNFVKNPLPKGGSGTGAVPRGDAYKNAKPGALGKGLVAANAVTTTFTFLSYVVPIIGAILADTKWGRFKAVWVGTLVGIFAHILIVIPAIPAVIKVPDASLAVLIVSIMVLACAAGFLKPSISPLLCDQVTLKVKRPTIQVQRNGERVIVDPETTVGRWLMIFYLSVNIGCFFSIATTYAERFVGFWLGLFLPGIVYAFVPLVLLLIKNRLQHAPPQGSVVLEAWGVIRILLANGGWWKALKGGGDSFWDRARPSYIAKHNNVKHPDKVYWDDLFVDEIRRTVSACGIFVLLPVYNLAQLGIASQLGAMSVSMVLNHIPNDIMANFNPLGVVIGSPLLTYGFYPLMAYIGYPLAPMTRISLGFVVGSIGSTIAAIVQWKISQTSPCGWYATSCDDVSRVSIAWLIPILVIPAIGELMANVTAYEVAYTHAPARMKGLVFALCLFSTAISAAFSLACAGLIKDPWLVWPWVALTVAALICAAIFPTYFRHMNKAPDTWNDEARQAGKLTGFTLNKTDAARAEEEESPELRKY